MESEEWVYGFYNHIPCGRFLCDEHLIQTVKEDGRIGDLHRVFERTVGQYTGLSDKNGVLVFEGDIIETTGGRQSVISVVKFGEYFPKMFYHMLDNLYPRKKHVPAVGFYAESVDCGECMILFQSKCVEVIGNIHDNPELLEVEHGDS